MTTYLEFQEIGYSLKVETNSQEIIEFIRAAYSTSKSLRINGFSKGTIKIVYHPETYSIQFKDSIVFSSASFEKSIGYIGELIEQLISSDDSYIPLHGGLVENEEQKAFGIIAPSYAGKTTLVCYLGMMGWKMASDDLIMIRRGDLSLSWINLPIFLRGGEYSNEILNYYAPYYSAKIYNQNLLKFENKSVISTSSDHKSTRIEGFLVLDRDDKHNILTIQKLTGNEAAYQLMVNIKTNNMLKENMNGVLKFAKTTPVWLIRYHDTKKLAKYLHDNPSVAW